jgi:hypothetical protein
MNASNGFREDELICRRQKINGEWVENYFPRVGGRLRLAHEQNDQLGIQTDVIRFDETLAVVKATVSTAKGSFCGFGTASAQRDARLADSLLELAETRSIARALRFSGYGVEYTGAEEVSHVMPDTEQTAGRSENKDLKPVLQPVEQQDKPETKPAQQPKGNGNGNGHKATQAQCRALHALSRRAKYEPEDLTSMLSPLNAARFEDLTVADASRLIQYLQTEVAA